MTNPNPVPPKPSGRQQVAFRLSNAAIEGMDEMAAEYGLSRSDVVRVCFAVALNHHKPEVVARLKEMRTR